MKFNKFKLLFYLLPLVILPLLSFGEDTVGALFLKGNALYAKGQYKEALADYQQIIAEGYQSAAVYFNMGNASYKNGDIPSALLYLEKAHKLAPGDDDINFNLKYVNLKTTDKIDEVPQLFLIRWFKGLIFSFTTKGLAVWSIVFVLLASATLAFYFFAGSVSLKRFSFYISMSLFFLGVLCVFMANRQLSYFDNHKQAIVFSGSVNVKGGPVDKSAVLFVIHDGTKVNILDSNSDWLKISLANGNEGWIKAADVKEI